MALRPSSERLAHNLLLCVPRPDLSRAATTCLVNLSQDDVLCKGLVAANACSRLITYVVEGKTLEHDLAMMTLSNLTRTDEGAKQALQVGLHNCCLWVAAEASQAHRATCHRLSSWASAVQIGQGALEYSGMRKLLSVALNPGASNVMYEHVAGVLCNLTRQQPGRKLLLDSDLHGLRAVVRMLSSPSLPKRTGAAATVKNMVMAAKEDGWFDTLVSTPELLQALLVRLHVLAEQLGCFWRVCHLCVQLWLRMPPAAGVCKSTSSLQRPSVPLLLHSTSSLQRPSAPLLLRSIVLTESAVTGRMRRIQSAELSNA